MTLLSRVISPSEAVEVPKKKRIRVSSKALDKALSAAKEHDMPVHTIRVEGSAFIIEFSEGVEPNPKSQHTNGLKGWD